MLGEMIGEVRGKITGTRVLQSDGQGPNLEIAIQESGKILGFDITQHVTATSIPWSGGAFYGEEQGVLTTDDGETATWKGVAVGKPTGSGKAQAHRGMIFYQTASQKLKRLNGIAVVYEVDLDENGNTHGKFWEWK